MPKREGIRYSTKTYPICDSLLWRSARRSFALLQKPNEDWPALKTGNGDVQHESTWKARNGFPPSSRAHLVQPIPKEGVSAWELRPRSHWSPLNFRGLFFFARHRNYQLRWHATLTFFWLTNIMIGGSMPAFNISNNFFLSRKQQ